MYVDTRFIKELRFRCYGRSKAGELDWHWGVPPRLGVRHQAPLTVRRRLGPAWPLGSRLQARWRGDLYALPRDYCPAPGRRRIRHR